MIRLAVAGATGRMGRCVMDLALRDERFEPVIPLTAPGDPMLGRSLHLSEREIPVVDELAEPCDVLVDFTVADGTMAWLDVCLSRGIAMLIGATGHSPQQLRRIEEAARRIPIVKASNCSIGVQAILSLLGPLVARLGDGYDVAIVEAHHRHKRDAPSGTALTLFDEISAARGTCELTGGGPTASCERQGQDELRETGAVAVHALRMGDLVGWHEIHFSGPGETITIRHAAHSRDTFAAGALRAAAWLIDQPAGYYTMLDVLRDGGVIP